MQLGSRLARRVPVPCGEGTCQVQYKLARCGQGVYSGATVAKRGRERSTVVVMDEDLILAVFTVSIPSSVSARAAAVYSCRPGIPASSQYYVSLLTPVSLSAAARFAACLPNATPET